MTRLDRCWGLMVSVGIGVILALPVHAYMVDYEICSKKLADMLVGLVGLGMPDLFKTNLPQIQKFLVEKFLNKSAVGKVDHD